MKFRFDHQYRRCKYIWFYTRSGKNMLRNWVSDWEKSSDFFHKSHRFGLTSVAPICVKLKLGIVVTWAASCKSLTLVWNTVGLCIFGSWYLGHLEMLLPVLQMANGQQFLQIRPFLAVQVLATASLSLSIFWTYFPAIVAAIFATLVTFQQFVHITQLWPDFTLLTISNNFGRILNFHPDFTMYNSLFWHSSINFDHISEYYLKKKREGQKIQ